MRAVIYARYSTDLQRTASIDDQIRVCRERIEREGWTYLHAYHDRAMSGTSHLRPGYQKLLNEAQRGIFDVVVAEALDRLSRDQEHVAHLYKRLTFLGIKLVTVSEGAISELHVGLSGTMERSTSSSWPRRPIAACAAASRTGAPAAATRMDTTLYARLAPTENSSWGCGQSIRKRPMSYVAFCRPMSTASRPARLPRYSTARA